LGGAINHEIYFANLGGGGDPANDRMGSLINRDFGSFDTWATDLKFHWRCPEYLSDLEMYQAAGRGQHASHHVV